MINTFNNVKNIVTIFSIFCRIHDNGCIELSDLLERVPSIVWVTPGSLEN